MTDKKSEFILGLLQTLKHKLQTTKIQVSTYQHNSNLRTNEHKKV